MEKLTGGLGRPELVGLPYQASLILIRGPHQKTKQLKSTKRNPFLFVWLTVFLQHPLLTKPANKRELFPGSSSSITSRAKRTIRACILWSHFCIRKKFMPRNKTGRIYNKILVIFSFFSVLFSTLDFSYNEHVVFLWSKMEKVGTPLAVQWLTLHFQCRGRGLQGAQFRSLVGELGSCMPRGAAKKKKCFSVILFYFSLHYVWHAGS